MARVSFEQMMNRNTGSGSSYFVLKSGEEARVRFLYDSLVDIELYDVHEFVNAAKRSTTISCARADRNQPIDNCKWCMTGNQPVGRVIIPIYNEDQGQIQYWKRTETWVKNTLVPQLQELPTDQSIASQPFKIKRQGNGIDTNYSVVRTGACDASNKLSFGEIKSPFDTGMIKESTFNYNPDEQPQGNNYNQNNNNYVPNNNFNQGNSYNQNNNFNQGQQGNNFNQGSFGGGDNFGQPTGRRTTGVF